MAERWIVVGAGSAGCVLANRLSADPDRHVTLVDSGPALSPGEVPPGVDGSNFFAALETPGRMYDDLVARRRADGEATLYQRGRGIGGSSAVNAMVALRGSEERYRSWGWTDTAESWSRIALTEQPATADELGAVDRALLHAAPDATAALMTRKDGSRVTSTEAYLWPVLDRPNLSVRPDSEVDVVLFDGRRATGVRLIDGTELDAEHVVLSAGAIHSPVILLRSGVDVEGIGLGLQDHPSAVFTLVLRDGVAQDPTGLAIGSHLHRTIGDDLIQLLPMSHLGERADVAGLGALMVALMTPTGRAGTVCIDDAGSPVVDFALLDDDRDLRALTSGAHLALRTLEHPAFTDIVDRVAIDDVGTLASTLTTDDTIADWLRVRCGDYVHASGTCAMGTVVDQRGAVNGYEDLYVCDASIFPEIPDANTHLPTTMAAERLCTPGRLLPPADVVR